MAEDATIDPLLLEGPYTFDDIDPLLWGLEEPYDGHLIGEGRHNQVLDVDSQPQLRIGPLTLEPTQNLDLPVTLSDGEGNQGSEKRRKLNLWKCRQCREARKKCFPVERVWPQKCNRCFQHRPEPLECTEPQLNTRKRGPNLKSRPSLKKADPPKSSDDDEDECSEGEFSNPYERPVRMAVLKRTRREYPGLSEAAPGPIRQPSIANANDSRYLDSAYLPLGEDNFRILSLAPGRKEDEVVFSFRTASISRPEEYEAVSYFWGANGTTNQKSVGVTLLDSHRKPHNVYVKSALHDALKSLRHPNQVRSFWVDAMCINRSNVNEMSRQIAMKLEIFRHAVNLCLWLGEDANSSNALAFIPRILDLTGVDKLVRDDSALDGWAAFVDLLRNPVFSRLWLVQEVAVAKNVTLHCGLPAIHYTDLADAVAIFESFQADLSLLYRRNGKNHKELTDRKITMAKRFIDVSTNALRITSSGKIQRLLSLEALVSQLSDLSVGDPRDRVFSVLAVAKDGFQLVEETLREDRSFEKPDGALRVDYEKSVRDVYQEFVIHAIEDSGSLDLICRHWASSVLERDVNLPTWVRSLQSALQQPFGDIISERTEAESIVGLPGHSYYDASKGAVADFRVHQSVDNEKSLIARGIRADTISNLGPRASEGIVLYEWLELGGCLDVDETVPEGFWRTLVADRGPTGQNAPSWYARAFLYCLHQVGPFRDINTNRLISECEAEAEASLVVDFLHRVQSVIWNRKFLVSKDNKWIGLAPMAAQVGDIICVLFGCSVPVVLRLQTGGWFQLVGECYVCGIMNGEVCETAKSSGYSEQEFELR